MRCGKHITREWSEPVIRRGILCQRARIGGSLVHATVPTEASYVPRNRYPHVILAIAVVDGDGNLQNEIRLPNDRLDELAEQYAGGEAAIEASGHYRPAYEMLDGGPRQPAAASVSYCFLNKKSSTWRLINQLTRTPSGGFRYSECQVLQSTRNYTVADVVWPGSRLSRVFGVRPHSMGLSVLSIIRDLYKAFLGDHLNRGS